MTNDRYINPSGFPENLPPVQLVEDDLKTKFANRAESYGYGRLETTAVEYMDTLATKGEIDKEIFTISRALGEGEGNEESERGLHFDLTVPFARFVAQNQGQLWFPYRRYQIQKVWRGERPQKGRFREFYQADVDVVARENLAISYDAEVILVMASILSDFNIGSITMHINNRKFLSGLFTQIGIVDSKAALQAIDKLDKIGYAEVKKILCTEIGILEAAADRLFEIINKKVAATDVESFLAAIAGDNEDLSTGREELNAVFAILNESNVANVSFVFNPSIARGLDYYTGTVVETTVDGLEKYGSICSGGRYADLANKFTNQKLPGVGLSIGLTRLLSIIKDEGLLSLARASKTDVSVCLLNNEQLNKSIVVAESLRNAGLNVEVSYKANSALGKQLEQIKQRGIPYGLVCEQDGKLSVFVVESGDKQVFADVESLVAYLKE